MKTAALVGTRICVICNSVSVQAAWLFHIHDLYSTDVQWWTCSQTFKVAAGIWPSRVGGWCSQCIESFQRLHETAAYDNRREVKFYSPRFVIFFDNGPAVCRLNEQISKDHRQDHSIILFSLKGARFDFSLKAKKRWMDFKCTERCVPTEHPHGFLPCYAVHFSKKRGQKCMENRVGSRLAD